MGKPSTKGFSRNVYTQPVHSKQEELKFEANPDELDTMVKEFKPLITSIVKRAFIRYCKAHGASPEVEELEWKRFNKIFQGML